MNARGTHTHTHKRSVSFKYNCFVGNSRNGYQLLFAQANINRESERALGMVDMSAIGVAVVETRLRLHFMRHQSNSSRR